MDARLETLLETLSDELCQVNTRVGCIARRQARLGGFIESPSPPPNASDDDNDDEIGMLVHPAMTGCLLDTLTLCHS